MPISAADVEAAAASLAEAERTHVLIQPLTETYPGLDMADAYAIQSAWVRTKVAAGDPPTGWKIGLTSRAMQVAAKMDTPNSGVLLQSMMFENGAVIPPKRFIDPRIEAEIAFKLKAPLKGPRPSFEDILAATEYVVPCFEILDTRIMRINPLSGRTRSVLDSIADNAVNAGVVLGDPFYDFGAIDLRWIGAIVSRNGIVEETGLGAGVLNSPLLSVSWLIERLQQYGDKVEASEILLSGSFIRPIDAPPGSTLSADFGPLGLVSCYFE